MAAFQKAFNEQFGIDEDTVEEDVMAALMLDEFEDAPACMAMEDSDVSDDWLLSDCA